jgi:hypothetical protein
MYFLDSKDEWNNIHPEDLWIYNKLILNTRLRHLCGPTGVPVPVSGHYIVRPSMNLLGMGRNARVEWINNDTEHFHPAEFWCELFDGNHYSIDYHKKEPELCVIGTRCKEDPLYKWKKWERVDHFIEFPEILSNLRGSYEWINCEFIGDHLIEVHFRRNPDFRYNNNVAIPLWNDEKYIEHDKMGFVSDKDYLRKGFYID